ncbi:hypothetical protein SFMTTN_1539 [Sulfuriferula multivorans]|uniref:Uncharacterized protein n=1 Tax=Sulfuriferula multivorans TaxID=1559896 RepID=A0A401JDI0_9PROT|nr:hypothetical protein SFMTTN_1539 [Sulfuriferula multivorans]
MMCVVIAYWYARKGLVGMICRRFVSYVTHIVGNDEMTVRI